MTSTRFSLLSVGTRFEYDGKWYVKNTPLIAAAADGGGQRMIPRSAMVNVEAGATGPARQAPEAIPTERLQEALGRYHAEALACVAGAAAGLKTAEARLEAAHTRLLAELGLHDHAD